jgi:hypothetical protein
MLTLKGLTEQILRAHSRYNPTSDRTINEGEIRPLIFQVLNSLLKTEIYQLHEGNLDHNVPHALIATYIVDVVPSTNPPKVLECSSVVAGGLFNAWLETGVVPWITQDTNSPWLVPGQPNVSMSIVYESNYSFQITLSGFSWPSGVTPSQIQTAMLAIPTQGYWEVKILSPSGAASFIPTKFFRGACSALTVTANEVSFKYNYFDASQNANSFISAQVLPTINILQGYLDNTQYSISYDSLHIEALLGCKEAFRDENIDAEIMLPAHPINTHMGKGVWAVYPVNRPYEAFIPLQSNMGVLAYNADHHGMKDFLKYRNCYEWRGQNTIRINQPASDFTGKLEVQLLISDLKQLREYDPLPIPADMEFTVITEVLKFLGVREQPDMTVNENPND